MYILYIYLCIYSLLKYTLIYIIYIYIYIYMYKSLFLWKQGRREEGGGERP